jgi:hypothetical protein
MRKEGRKCEENKKLKRVAENSVACIIIYIIFNVTTPLGGDGLLHIQIRIFESVCGEVRPLAFSFFGGSGDTNAEESAIRGYFLV